MAGLGGTNETPREPNFTPLQQVSLAIEVIPSLKLPLMLSWQWLLVALGTLLKCLWVCPPFESQFAL